MNKQEFLKRLRKVLPEGDREERLSFYSEMIDDRMEEGLSEEEAVRAVGCLENILEDTTQPETEKIPGKKWSAWQIVLLALGSPVWLSLLIAAFAVVLSLYVTVWAGIVSLWAAFGACFACALSGLAASVGFLIGGHILPGILTLGGGMACAGLAILLLWGCKAATKGTVRLTGMLLKKCFPGKENL